MDTRGVTWCPIWPPGVPRDRIFADNSKGGLEFPLPTGNAVFGCPNDHMHARGGGGGGKNSYITFFGGGGIRAWEALLPHPAAIAVGVS